MSAAKALRKHCESAAASAVKVGMKALHLPRHPATEMAPRNERAHKLLIPMPSVCLSGLRDSMGVAC